MEQTLQLAIVTNDHIRAEAVAKIVGDLHWQLVACVNQAQPAEWLRRRSVDLALVDLDLPNAIALLTQLAHALPHLPLMALTTPHHLVELQEALLAGAASFVAYPIEPGQFTGTILRAVQNNPQRGVESGRGRIIALAGLKGGVGRTTLAVNLAVLLRRRSAQEVILVEAHHGLGDVSIMLNLLPKHTLASLAEESNIDLDVIQGHLQPHHASGIQVLAAPPDLVQLVELPVETWRHLLSSLAQLAPYVIVDTAAVADAVLSEVLTHADDILVVTGPDLAGLRSAAVLLQSLDQEENVHGRSQVVLNRAGVRGGVTESACSKQVGEKIVAAIPDDPALVTFALNRGVPFVLNHPRSIVGREVGKLLEQIVPLGQKGSPAGKQQTAGDAKPQGVASLKLPFMKQRAAAG